MGIAGYIFGGPPVPDPAPEGFGGLLNNIARFSTRALDVSGYDVTRISQGTYGTDGTVVPGTTSTFTINASVQPYSGRKLKVLPEGVNTEDVRIIYTNVALQVMTSLNVPDAITIAGERFVVFRVDGPFHMSGVTSYTCYVARRVNP